MSSISSYQGSVRVWDNSGDGEEMDYGILETGDKIGEESLITGWEREFSVSTLEDSVFLVMHADDFDYMLDSYPSIKQFMLTLMETRRQARLMSFPWLHPGEIVQIITRRHPIQMVLKLFSPLFLILVGGGFLLLSGAIKLPTLPMILGVYIIIALALLWMVWIWLDWRNDYFILTNQRVIWLEQVIFQAAARQEAPLAAVQSVDVKTTQIGRILDYGDVLVRTFTGTGSLTLTAVDHPKHMKGEIEELLIRVRKKTENIEEQRLRQSIRQSLGIDTETEIRGSCFPHWVTRR